MEAAQLSLIPELNYLRWCIVRYFAPSLLSAILCQCCKRKGQESRYELRFPVSCCWYCIDIAQLSQVELHNAYSVVILSLLRLGQFPQDVVELRAFGFCIFNVSFIAEFGLLWLLSTLWDFSLLFFKIKKINGSGIYCVLEHIYSGWLRRVSLAEHREVGSSNSLSTYVVSFAFKRFSC